MRLNLKEKMDLGILSLIIAIAAYFFFRITEPWIFWLDVAIIASCIYSLPFMFQPLQAGFASLPKSLFEASYSLGKGKWETLFRVALPNIKPSLLTALIVSFAHTLGEFGVVLMIGGSVGDKTKVASIAIYEAVELMDYTKAHVYSAIMLFISFAVLFLVYFFNNSHSKRTQ